jgi:perosamine synthetase
MKIPHNRPTFDYKEIRAAKTTLKSRWVSQGKKVFEFEEKFCEFMGLPEGHAVAVSSGSAALYIAILALEGKGQRIGLPVYTCAAVNNAVALADGVPVFIDNSFSGPNLDIFLADRAELHTLIAVSTFGIPMDFLPGRRYRVIEDISQALGARVGQRQIGLAGDVGVCSLSSSKLITAAGQGGMIFSTSRSLADFARDYRDFDARHDRVSRFNFQMPDLQAAVGAVQLKKLPSFLTKRQEIFDIYSESGLNLLRETHKNHSAVRYRAVIRSENPTIVQNRLQEEGIRTIVPYTFDELLRTSDNEKNAINFSRTSLSIPIYPSLSLRHASKIARSVNMAIGKR